VFPAGTEIGLEIWRALKDCKEIELYAAESVESSHTSYVYGKRSLIPDARAKGFISSLKGVIQKNGINMVFPAHDDVVTALAENAQAVKAKVVSSPLDTCLTCRYRTRTYLRFEGLLPVPRIFNRPSDVKSFPVFVKPDRGQGSKDAALVKDMATLKTLLENDKGLIVMENLPGKEYTVDCFSDRERGLLFFGRERKDTRAKRDLDGLGAGGQDNERCL
jgi:carbamoyl-phosphate synthase large subunit